MSAARIIAPAQGISFGTGFLGDGDGGEEVAAFDLLDGGDGDPADQAAPRSGDCGFHTVTAWPPPWAARRAVPQQHPTLQPGW